MADPALIPPAKTFRGMVHRALDEGQYDPHANWWESISRNSALAGALPWSKDRRYREVFANESIPLQGRVGYVLGRIVKDFVADGSRTPIWAGNHPLGVTKIAGDVASDAAGFRPTKVEIDDLKADAEANGRPTSYPALVEEWAKSKGYSTNGHPEGIPLELAAATLPLAASVALVSASGSHDLSNLAGGGRTEGFEAVFNDGVDKSVSDNPAGELATRYFLGRSGRLLPWEEFTQERPEIGPSDYEQYRAFQFDKGALGLNLLKATDRNLQGEPEFVMMGFQVPLTGASSAGGALVGGIAGANTLDELIRQRYAQRLQDVPGKLALLKTTAGRRVAGAALGALAGALSGRLGAEAVNDLAIQPILNPEALANQLAWEKQQEALGLL